MINLDQRSLPVARRPEQLNSTRMKKLVSAFCVAAVSSMANVSAAVSPSGGLSAPTSTLLRPSDHQYAAHNSKMRTQSHAFLTLSKIRGGADVDSAGSKKRKGKSSKKSAVSEEIISTATDGDGEDDDDGDAKSAINEVMKETDAATALGDAIRERAHILRQDRLPFPERTFDSALVSLGLSMGTAGTDKDGSEDTGTGEGGESSITNGKVDTLAYYQYSHRGSIGRRRGQNQQHVQPSTSAVIAYYFLKTHGGTHAIQCLLSLLASVLGMACLVLPAFPSSAAALGASATASTAASKAINAKSLSRKILLSTVKYQLMQQALLCAMAKHASGLLGAILLGASSIPQLGIRNVRRHLEVVASDPVGQYLFYCSLLVVWLAGGAGGMREYVANLRGSVTSIMNASAAASGDASGGGDAAVSAQLLDTLSQSPPPWFLSSSYGGSIIPILILGPILLREVISVIWMFSDVLTLAFTSSGGMTGKFLSGILSGCRSVLDAFMSILITSDKWRKADSFQRQRSLATLVSKCSLMMELAVGVMLIGDAILSFWTFAFAASAGGRIPFKSVLGKMACAHLYLNFLLSRRKKIATALGSIRGGAIVNRVLDVLIDPKGEILGLVEEDDFDDK